MPKTAKIAKNSKRREKSNGKNIFIPLFVGLIFVFFVIQNSSFGFYATQGAKPQEPTPTLVVLSPTPTSAPEELLSNRSFEKDADGTGIPDGWEYHSDTRVNTGMMDCTAAHSGNCSMKLLGGEGSTVKQYIPLSNRKTGLLSVSGWSKATDVNSSVGEPGKKYELRVRLYFDDGSEGQTHAISFDGGTHDWQKAELETRIEKPMKAIELFVSQTISGFAWFDDMSIVLE